MVFLMRAVVVEDDVNLLMAWNLGDHVIHERLEVRALFCAGCLRLDFACGYIEMGYPFSSTKLFSRAFKGRGNNAACHKKQSLHGRYGLICKETAHALSGRQ